MSLEIARCPYCKSTSAFVDPDLSRLVLPVKRTGGQPCPHVACISASLDVSDATGRQIQSRTRSWFWSVDRKLISGRPTRASRFVDLLFADAVDEDSMPQQEFELRGGTALERECSREGTGEIRLGPDRSKQAMLDGWCLYSKDPIALMREIRNCVEAS